MAVNGSGTDPGVNQSAHSSFGTSFPSSFQVSGAHGIPAAVSDSRMQADDTDNSVVTSGGVSIPAFSPRETLAIDILKGLLVIIGMDENSP